MGDELEIVKKKNQEKQISKLPKQRNKNYFWGFFLFYVIAFTFLLGESIEKYGFFYIFFLNCFASVFFSWVSSLIMLWFQRR